MGIFGSDDKDLNKQQDHWDSKFLQMPQMFGDSPSDAAIKAAEIFLKESKTDLLELGGGQGRDTLFFAESGFQVQVLDYSQSGIDAITHKSRQRGLAQNIRARQHDIRAVLPFEDNTFDACYSHMLYCMALRLSELEALSEEIRRVLKPGGINVYTARHTGDAHYGTGIHRGEDLYEVNGFIVHFFSEEKVAQLAKGYDLVGLAEFEEGQLPRKLFRVTLMKK